MKTKLSLTACTVVLAVGLAGCAAPAKFTGGGWMPSTSGGAKDKANLSINVQNCDPENTPIHGRFNFHDRLAPAWASSGGVKLHGWVVRGGVCTVNPFMTETVVAACDVFNLAQTGVPAGFCPPDSGNVGVDIEYESTNPKIQGSGGGGTAVACFQDNGEGASATSDFARIFVIDGPYAGYSNAGTVKGNLQQHACTCADGLDNEGDGLVDGDDPTCQLVLGVNGSES